MRFISTTLISLSFFLSLPSLAQISFSDSFESRDLSANQSLDFTWGSMNRTSLVSQDPVLGDLVIFNRQGPIELQQSQFKNWKARHGNVAMRFDFPAGKNSWAEQRFSLTKPQRELWVRFWLKVPENFRHGRATASNNKLFALWMDQYSAKGAGPTVIWEFWNDGSDGSQLAYHYSPGGYRAAGAHRQHKPFISYPADQGRWMQIVMRVKAASGQGKNDGVIQLYRRWDGEGSFTLLHDDRAANIPAPASGPNGWKAGYFMGWSNPGYPQATEWLIDDLHISNMPLLDTGIPLPVAAAPVSPKAPAASAAVQPVSTAVPANWESLLGNLKLW